MTDSGDLLCATCAARRAGVAPAVVYAWVKRGWLATTAEPGDDLFIDPAVLDQLLVSRERAFEVLYEADQRALPPVTTGLSPKAVGLVEGVVGHLAEIDAILGRFAPQWRVARMPVVDRTLLRLGVYELLHEPVTPAAVVLSEAVRLASEYSTERSAPFVNGVLAALADELVAGRDG